MNHSYLALLFYLLSFLFTCRLRWWQYLLNIPIMVENVPYYSVVILKKNQAYWFIIKLKTTGL